MTVWTKEKRKAHGDAVKKGLAKAWKKEAVDKLRVNARAQECEEEIVEAAVAFFESRKDAPIVSLSDAEIALLSAVLMYKRTKRELKVKP